MTRCVHVNRCERIVSDALSDSSLAMSPPLSGEFVRPRTPSNEHLQLRADWIGGGLRAS